LWPDAEEDEDSHKVKPVVTTKKTNSMSLSLPSSAATATALAPVVKSSSEDSKNAKGLKQKKAAVKIRMANDDKGENWDDF